MAKFNKVTKYMNVSYQKICSPLIKTLPKRMADIIERRFGLKSNQRETLQSIGRSFNITRERVRQIEAEAISRLRAEAKNKAQPAFRYFNHFLKTYGNLKREDILLNLLGKSKFQNHVFFLLTLGEQFERFKETPEYHSLWTRDTNSFHFAQEIISSLVNWLEQKNQPISLEDRESFSFLSSNPLPPKKLESYLEISKLILKGPEGLYGLKDWLEINPKSVRDKIYVVFKKEKRPLHFKEVAELIESLELPKSKKTFSLQTIHNELIRDSRFVLIGRGIYALKEWGYLPGVVKDVIFQILRESKYPLTEGEIVEKVRLQRQVKRNTILLNLRNKDYFLKDSKGRYTIKTI